MGLAYQSVYCRDQAVRRFEVTVLDSVQRAIALRSSFPKAHALDLLDLVFEGHALTKSETRVLTEEGAMDPQTLAFIASAFDRGMTEQEWHALQQPPADPLLQAAVRGIWLESVVPAFAERYTGHERPPLHQQPRARLRSIVSM
jgi:hypothetical protein